jgi:hypothetical protein
MVGQRHRTLERGVDVSAMAMVVVMMLRHAIVCGIGHRALMVLPPFSPQRDLRQDQEVQVVFPPKISHLRCWRRSTIDRAIASDEP